MSRHFRARVRFTGRYAQAMPVYEFLVINQHSGEVIATDDHCGFSKLHDQARDLVRAASLAWSYGFRAEDLA